MWNSHKRLAESRRIETNSVTYSLMIWWEGLDLKEGRCGGGQLLWKRSCTVWSRMSGEFFFLILNTTLLLAIYTKTANFFLHNNERLSFSLRRGSKFYIRFKDPFFLQLSWINALLSVSIYFCPFFQWWPALALQAVTTDGINKMCVEWPEASFAGYITIIYNDHL